MNDDLGHSDDADRTDATTEGVDDGASTAAGEAAGGEGGGEAADDTTSAADEPSTHADEDRPSDGEPDDTGDAAAAAPDQTPPAPSGRARIVIDTSPRPVDDQDEVELDLDTLDELDWPDLASMPSVRRRLPYFERARPPHDWRWFVGGFGRLLITLGLLLFGLVGYQLWGTGIATAKAQDELSRELDEILAQITTTTSTTTTTVPTSVEPSTPTETTDPETANLPSAPMAPNVPSGTPLGKIQIPSIDVDWTFVQGVKYADLKNGPGHFRETPLPGQLGNAAIAGHRTTWGAPFFDLDKLKVGDEIVTITALGRHVWEVTDSFVVAPSDYKSVVPTKDRDKPTLTLVTCTPKYSASARLVIKAQLLDDESDQVYAAPDVLPSPEVFQGDGDATETVVVPGTAADGTPTQIEVPDFGATGQRSDAFSAGWFDDTAAIPHVIGWGVTAMAAAIAAWLFGRRFRRLWLVFVSGAVPVAVTLFFFYENVNRLLPPGL